MCHNQLVFLKFDIKVLERISRCNQEYHLSAMKPVVMKLSYWKLSLGWERPVWAAGHTVPACRLAQGRSASLRGPGTEHLAVAASPQGRPERSGSPVPAGPGPLATAPECDPTHSYAPSRSQTPLRLPASRQAYPTLHSLLFLSSAQKLTGARPGR